ncbi:protein of unknown function [Bradyrhizobium erythrophlei]|uniref:DUF305 domain-containing protein n=2 Tax=Bradyrhizobium erythrophlei TaxID=1437360 RepID=A0A1H5GEQ3_9BRAD|nr:protein of unknown function [Bradyrhizobium erythrophlei]
MSLFSRGFMRRRAISLTTSLSVMATQFALAHDPSARPHARTRSAANERQLLLDNDVALSKMSRGPLIKPSRDVDRDFASIMISHPQGAIDMARTDLRYGHDDALRQLAARIVAQREQEMSVERSAPGAAAGSSSPNDDRVAPTRSD